MLLVIGGWNNDDGILDSTEILTLEATASWRAGAALPSPMSGLSAANIDHRILIFGIDSSTFFDKM